jgi:hypothetical protein
LTFYDPIIIVLLRLSLYVSRTNDIDEQWLKLSRSARFVDGNAIDHDPDTPAGGGQTGQ